MCNDTTKRLSADEAANDLRDSLHYSIGSLERVDFLLQEAEKAHGAHYVAEARSLVLGVTVRLDADVVAINEEILR